MNTSGTTVAIPPETSPLPTCLTSSTSDSEHETRSPVSAGSGENERPERMRDWLIRMINSGRFIGLEWLDKEKTVFKVPWIHAKKRGYCRERDAALFREWAIHSGKYRQDSDPTVWKINFRCAINGLKDIQEIKDMQTEDCRVYKVYPSRSRRRRRTAKRNEPYPTSCSSTAYTDMSSQHLYSAYSGSYGMPATSSTDSIYSNYSTAVPPNVKLEYPGAICGTSHLYGSGIPPANGLYSSTRQIPTSSGMLKSNSNSYYGDHVPPVQIPNAKNCTALSRVDSPDSGINVEVQNSPSGMIQQSSPLQQQHSPPLHQQHSSPIHQQHSPPIHSPPTHQQHSPSPPSQQHSSSLEQKPFVHSLPNCSSMSISSPLNTCCHSPSMTGSPTQSILSEEDNDAVSRILDDLEDNPPTPPISPRVSSDKLLVNVYYGTISVLSEEVDCSAGKCRIVSSKSPQTSPTGYPAMHTIALPDNHPQALSRDIFTAMENGIVLEVSNGDVYVTPLCRTMIYCSSSPAPSQKAQPITREYPTCVFSYNQHFRPALEHYALIQGQSPSPHFFLGLGQNWGCGHHVSQNLITITVTHCKAKYDIDTIGLPQLVAQELLIEIPDNVDVNSPTGTDLQAEAFLQNLEKISN